MTPSHRIIRFATAWLVATLATTAQAQSSDSARIRDLEKRLERSLELIDQLSSKISKLEQANASAAEAQTEATQKAARIGAIEKHVAEISSNLSRRSTDEGLPVHGFADVALVHSSEDNVSFTGRKGAVLGNFGLYLAPQFSDRAKALVELVFENDDDGNIEGELERLQIGYAFSDAATAWAGRFHTPLGYWNTAFHHGAQLHTSTVRPRFLEFEDKGGILPSHTVGGWLTGTLGTAKGKFGYDAYVGNAPQINGTAAGSPLAAANPSGFSAIANAGGYAGSGTLSARQGGNTQHRSSTGFNVWFEPREFAALRVGLHSLRANVVDDTANANRTRLNVFGGYFAYHDDRWEALGEYYRFRNQDRSGGTGTHNSWAGYTQIGYTLGKWTPFARTERSKLDQTDNYFGVQAGGRSYRRAAIGLRYDVEPMAALRGELLGTRKEDLGPGLTDKYGEFRLQYAIRF